MPYVRSMKVDIKEGCTYHTDGTTMTVYPESNSESTVFTIAGFFGGLLGGLLVGIISTVTLMSRKKAE